MPTDSRTGEDRRQGRRGGRRKGDPIFDLSTHRARVVGVPQLAEYWGYHVNTIKAWIKSGRLRAMHACRGGEYKILRDDALQLERELFKRSA